MSVDVSKLEGMELEQPGRWHVLFRGAISLDAGMVRVVDGQTETALEWPALRRLVGAMGHELLAARREGDGATVPSGEAWQAEARACSVGRVLREPWASVLALPTAPEDEGEDEGEAGDEDGAAEAETPTPETETEAPAETPAREKRKRR